MRTRKPYIGITGFTTPDQVIRVAYNIPMAFTYPVMAGILVSHKTLVGQPAKWPHRYPYREGLKKLFNRRDGVITLAHYNTQEPGTLVDQLIRVIAWAGPNIDGFQLNITWPDPQQLTDYRFMNPEHTIVLQINNGCFASVDYSPEKLAEKIKRNYEGLYEYALLDASGGTGAAMDVNTIRTYLMAFKQANILDGVGIAGGLSGDTIDQIQSLWDEFGPFSIDAEGQLRSKDEADTLVESKVDAYMQRSLKLFGYT